MRILVTGHDGYVGSVLMDRLRNAGHEPVGIDTYFFSGCGLVPGIRGRGSGFSPTDIREVPLEDLGGFHAVVHLAALSNDPLGSLDPDLTRAINQEGSIRLARFAREAGVSRFVFASSCSLYGTAGADLVGEDAPLKPLTAYGVSKVTVERALSELSSDEFSPTFLRASTAYGSSPRLRGDVVVNNLVGSALTRGEVRLLSDGKSWRPLLHVEDMCRAFQAVLEAPRDKVHGEAFNIVPEGENYQIREVADLVAQASGGCTVTFAEGKTEPDPRSYRVDGSKLLSMVPGFRPRWTLEEGIRQVFEALGSVSLTEEEFFGPRFIRIARLRDLIARGHVDRNLEWTAAGVATTDPPRRVSPELMASPPAAR